MARKKTKPTIDELEKILEVPVSEQLDRVRKDRGELAERLAKVEQENRDLRERGGNAQSPVEASGRFCRVSDGHAFVEKLFENAEWYGRGPSSVGLDFPNSQEQAFAMARDGKLRPYHEGYKPDAALLTFSQTRMIHDRLDRVEEMLRFLCRR